MTNEEFLANVRRGCEKRNAFSFRLLVCHSSPCRVAGAEAVYESLVKTVKELGLDEVVEVTMTGCTARCTDGPLVTVRIPGKEDMIYANVTPDCVIGILEEQLSCPELVEQVNFCGEP